MKRVKKEKRITWGLLGILVLSFGCGSAQEQEPGQEITLRFGAMVGEEVFACGETYEGLGSTETTFEPFDFRLYISEIELQNQQGQWEPLVLEQDGVWQHENVALLDFEDRSGRCQNGTSETNDEVVGRLVEPNPRGLRFTIGVPFALNHIDASTAPSPLNQTAMFWNWLGGYKFVRLEGATTELSTGWQFHLGSTSCIPVEGGGAQSCANENRVQVVLDDFDPLDKKVIFDVAALVEGANLDDYLEGTPRGCMSGPEDTDCATLFQNLGLSHSGVSGADSSPFIRVEGLE